MVEILVFLFLVFFLLVDLIGQESSDDAVFFLLTDAETGEGEVCLYVWAECQKC
jgi:hypothetical protein